ncbi:hypothetical protein [Gemmata sp.]|uniref:hypothetical protein n=1 Tax=Gemmata sp. TaxID=1914242 RepID=UPI003F703E99
MQIFDELLQPPAPPPLPEPPPPAMPYSIQPRVHGYGVFALERPTKVRPDGTATTLPTEDEVAVYAAVEHLEGQLRGAVPLDADPPEVPYLVRPLKVGIHGRERLEKLSTRGFSQGFMSGDESKVWSYVEALRVQVAAMKASAPAVAPEEPTPSAEPVAAEPPAEEPATARPKRAASQGR